MHGACRWGPAGTVRLWTVLPLSVSFFVVANFTAGARRRENGQDSEPGGDRCRERPVVLAQPGDVATPGSTERLDDILLALSKRTS